MTYIFFYVYSPCLICFNFNRNLDKTTILVIHLGLLLMHLGLLLSFPKLQSLAIDVS